MSDEKSVPEPTAFAPNVPMNEAELEEVEQSFEAPAPGDGTSTDEEWQQASKADTDGILDAVKELTKIISEFSQEFNKWKAAGKF